MIKITFSVLLASNVLAGILGGGVAGFFTLRVVRNQYVNDYYKTVIQRRLTAYEQIEGLIAMLKMSVQDSSDGRFYHFLFADGDRDQFLRIISGILSQSMWISDDIEAETILLNRLLYRSPNNESDPYSCFKDNYKEIAAARTRIEKMHSRDFQKLHDVKRFLKSKNPADSYELLSPGG
jgi:hypothetical protein